LARAKKPKTTRRRKAATFSKAIPPPDDLLRRIEQLDLEREAAEVAGITTGAVVIPHARGRKAAARSAAAPSAASAGLLAPAARMRLAALEHSSTMLEHEARGPVLTGIARTATLGAGRRCGQLDPGRADRHSERTDVHSLARHGHRQGDGDRRRSH
jgi:hypothetical protein